MGACAWTTKALVLIAVAATPVLALLACDGTLEAPSVSDAATPAASVLPKLLTTQPRLGNGTRDGGSRLDADAGTDAAPPLPPKPLRPDEILVEDPVPPHDLKGLVLQAQWRWHDVPVPAKVPEASKEGLAAAAELTALRWRIAIASTGRMRVLLESPAFPLAAGAVLLQRADRYGTLALWPEGATYRIIAPGALRTTLGEARVDVTPLSPGKLKKLGEGKHLNQVTRRVQLTSPIAQVVLDLADLPEAESGAPLLCRMMAELAGIQPSTPACKSAGVVLAAGFEWSGVGKDRKVSFEVTELKRVIDLRPEELSIGTARHTFSGLPRPEPAAILTAEQLAALRTKATEPPAKPPKETPAKGLVASNQSDLLLYLLLDGVPVVVVPPWSERAVTGLRSGRYVAQWRTFLGDLIDRSGEIELPARVTYGAVDAGAPGDGGT